VTRDLGFAHVYEPARQAGAPTLLMLHGTGGDEHDMLPLAKALAPAASILSPRGKVVEHGMPRFFRRLAEGVFDEADLRVRATELATFVAAAAAHYGFEPSRIVAVGFSNGANIAAGVLLLHPGVLSGAVLFRAMVPLVPATPSDLSGTRVLISNGRQDPLVAPAETERLARMMRDAGAAVDVHWEPAGHQLTNGDVAAARAWLSSSPAAPR